MQNFRHHRLRQEKAKGPEAEAEGAKAKGPEVEAEAEAEGAEEDVVCPFDFAKRQHRQACHSAHRPTHHLRCYLIKIE